METLLAFCSDLVKALRSVRGFHTTWSGGLPQSVLDRIDGLCSPSELPSSPPPRDGHLNIAVICREYPPETAYGGMATYCYNLAHGLIREGHRVTVISQGRPAIRHDFGGQVEVVRIQPRLRGNKRSFEALSRRGKLSFARNMLLYSIGLYKQLLDWERVRGPFDVIDLPDHGAEGVVPVLFWPRAKAIKLHSPWSLLNCMRANFFTEDDIEDAYALERATLQYADRITSPSRELADRTRTFFGLNRVVPLVPNPLDTDLFCPAERVPGPPRVCFAGRFEVRKGLTTLFEAIPTVLERHPDVEFHLVGRDVCSFRTVYAAHLDPARVRFHEALPLEKIPKFYQDSELAVVPSHYDNCPYTCVEPMACGIPVIGTECGGMPEIIEPGSTGLIIPGRDPGALAEAILQFLNDPAARQRMGKAARDRTVRLFDYRLVARQMADEYRKAITNSGGNLLPETELKVNATQRLIPGRPPDTLQMEIIILAKKDEARLVKKTLSSIRKQGRAIQSVTVLWEGGSPPPLHGCRVFRVTDKPIVTAARVFATVLTDLFLCLRAGDELDRSATTKIVWQFAAFGNIGVVTLPLSGVATAKRGREVYPVFRAEAVRGRSLSPTCDGSPWDEILQRMYEQVCQDGWEQVALSEVLLSMPGDRCEMARFRCVGLAVGGVSAKDRVEEVWARPGFRTASPALGVTPPPLRRVLLRAIRITSGPRLRPVRYRIRRLLDRFSLTKPLAAWLRREKGSLSMGGHAPEDDDHLGVVIVAESLAEGYARWCSLRALPAFKRSSPMVVVTGSRRETQRVNVAEVDDVAVYCLDGLLPRQLHCHAIAHLLRLHRRSVLLTGSTG